MEMIDSKIWDGVHFLLDNYAKVRDEDFVIVLYTSDSSEPAAWVSTALALREIPFRRVWMAPLWDKEFSARFTAALPDPAEVEGRLIVLGFERDTMSHTGPVANAISVYKNTQVFRAISACPSLFSTTFHVSPEDLSARNTTILKRLMPAKRLRITTESGSDLRIT